MNLRQITIKDQVELIKIYFDSINSIEPNLYSLEQKFAWCSQAWENPIFKETLRKGKGLILSHKNNNAGFGIRYPKNKLSLLYVRGEFKGNGFGKLILESIEKDAYSEGIDYLSTEASLLSFNLFLNKGWEIIKKEKVNIKLINFERYKMKKKIK